MSDSPLVRPAATVMLLRDSADGIEVFMLRRSGAAVFAAGMYVYPGGRVDPADGQGDEAFVVAAIRECYEEAGILLAVDSSGRMVGDGHPALQHRGEVHDGSLDIRTLADRYQLQLAADALVWVAHWITPREESARRFDTRFFVAAAPANQSSVHDDTETVASMWVRPTDALAQRKARQLRLLPPTIFTLTDLAKHATVESAMAAARTVGTPMAVLPKIRFDANGAVTGVWYPWHDDYDLID